MNVELFLTVVTASLLGSLHCVGMCGGFVAFYSTADGKEARWTGHLAYNLGRLLAYVALGATAGALGAALNLAGEASGLGRVAAVVCGTIIIGWGLLLLFQAAGMPWARVAAPVWLNRTLGRVLVRLRQWPTAARAGALGVSSALLPCGWLYGFAVTAAGTGSAETGALVMAAFWMGTVPAMLGTGLGAQRLAGLLGPRLGLLMPLTLVLVGALTVAQRSFIPHVAHAMAAGHGCAP